MYQQKTLIAWATLIAVLLVRQGDSAQSVTALARPTQDLIQWTADNLYLNTAPSTWTPNPPAFAPSYSHGLNTGRSPKSTTTNYAGAGQSPFTP